MHSPLVGSVVWSPLPMLTVTPQFLSDPQHSVCPLTSEGPRTDDNSYAETSTPCQRPELNSDTTLMAPKVVRGQPDRLVTFLITPRLANCVCVYVCVDTLKNHLLMFDIWDVSNRTEIKETTGDRAERGQRGTYQSSAIQT